MIKLDKKTVKENNTMQFRPGKIDCDYIHDFTMVEFGSNYFSNSIRKFHNSKIKRVLFVDPNEEQQSNIFSYYGVNPYKEVITLLIEEVSDFYDVKEYKIILLHNNKITHLQQDIGSAGFQVVRFKDYQQARKELNRLEEELKTSLNCLDSFK
tara:strand:+ start:105 stop:563 length:459 start_codon:yes stop_codon:yes gene_type:complete